jgi:hypothetical protein
MGWFKNLFRKKSAKPVLAVERDETGRWVETPKPTLRHAVHQVTKLEAEAEKPKPKPKPKAAPKPKAELPAAAKKPATPKKKEN